MFLSCVPSSGGHAKGSAQASGFTAAPPSYRHRARRKELSEVLPGGLAARRNSGCTQGGELKPSPPPTGGLSSAAMGEDMLSCCPGPGLPQAVGTEER